jgi:hypothetical protein
MTPAAEERPERLSAQAVRLLLEGQRQPGGSGRAAASAARRAGAAAVQRYQQQQLEEAVQMLPTPSPGVQFAEQTQ